jgi:hypothetical protein
MIQTLHWLQAARRAKGTFPHKAVLKIDLEQSSVARADRESNHDQLL